MPINSLGNNSFNTLPAIARDNRLRSPSVDIDDRSDRQPNRGNQPELILPTDDVQRVTRAESSSEPRFRPIPAFDELPGNLREALQSYISTAQATEPVANDGSELLVGVDTFV